MSIDHSLETIEKAQEAANFALYLFTEGLLFEQLSQEEINLKKRKRAKLMNQICSQVDMLGIETGSSNASSSRSPSKRAKIGGSSTSSPHDVNNNNDSSLLSDEINEDESEKSSSSFENDSTGGSPRKLAVYTLSARGNTWIGRRSIKRDLKSHQHEENTNELELERQCSLKLVEKNEQCAKEIDFRCEFVYEAAARKVNMKFALIHDDRFSTQTDLVDFDTLVHFLHVFVNTSMEKDGGFAQWSAQKQQN